MKIVNYEEFKILPNGTIFSYYSEDYDAFDGLFQKDKYPDESLGGRSFIPDRASDLESDKAIGGRSKLDDYMSMFKLDEAIFAIYERKDIDIMKAMIDKAYI